MSTKYDFTEIEAAFHAEQEKAEALVLERWREHLKNHPVDGDITELLEKPIIKKDDDQ